MSTPETRTGKRTRAPKVVIDAAHMPRLEALAQGAMQRNPDMADRLLDELSRARATPSAKMPASVISIGSSVTYRDETTGQETTVTLVFPEDADIENQRISLMTPIGIALLGLAEGATFHWNTRDNKRRTLTVVLVQQPSPGAVSA